MQSLKGNCLSATFWTSKKCKIYCDGSSGGAMATLCSAASLSKPLMTRYEGRFVPALPAAISLTVGCLRPIALAIWVWVSPERWSSERM